MLSNNFQKENIPKSQQRSQKVDTKNDSSINNTNNEFSLAKDTKNENLKGKKSILIKVLIIGISIILVFALVLAIILISTKKSEKKKYTIPIEDNEVEENIIDYDEAEKLIGSETIKENHNLLDKTSSNLNESLSICNNFNFTKINLSINDNPKNLEFLINSNESSLQVAQMDLDLYISKYQTLSEQTDTLTNDVSEYFKYFSDTLNEFKEENDNITKQFEKTIQNLAIPLLFNSTRLRNLELDEYKKEIEKLNVFYNGFFNKTNEVSEKIISSIKLIYESLDFLNVKVNDNIYSVNIILESITNRTNLHEKLIEIKNTSISFHKDNDNLISKFQNKKEEISKLIEEVDDFDLFKKEENDVITYFNGNLTLEMKTINNKNPVLEPFIEMNTNSIYSSLILTDLIITEIPETCNDFEMVNVEISTSLDLLFIMDITGSMTPYLEEVKKNIYTIINGIIEECPGIDINLGFIGYRDFYEEYIDIDFTQNYAYLKSIIDEADAYGGGDLPEDVAFALELALEKNWKSKARFAVFVADAPGHGEKYGGNKVYGLEPERRLIEEMISEMAEGNIYLFCPRISSKTDIMFKLFEDIYNEKKPNNTMFQIIDNKETSFSDEVINFAIKVYNEQKRNYYDSCLMPKHLAIEELKSKYGIINPNPDDNLRFILGKCSPVLLVPGIFATKLKVEFNCKGLATEEKDSTLKNIRLYCGKDVCKDEKKIKEEHSLLFSFNGPFGIGKKIKIKYESNIPYSSIGYISFEKYYGSCLGHISNYYQNENECPKVEGKNMCFYSKYVKVGYYGGTSDTLTKSRCGVEGISNVIQTGILTMDSILKQIVKSADAFNTISTKLIKKGYKEGFSLGALPNDYRRYLASNNFATEVFKSQINRLYDNTKRPVIVIAHSYGTLLTLTNLIKNQNDKEFLKKIKKFIAMAPPFSGATKLLDAFFQGNKDFDSKFSEFPLFGQNLIYKSLPTVMELRPLPMASKIFTDSSYNELGNALRGRLEIEKKCKNTNCDISEIETKTAKFDELFRGYFPSLLDSECSYESPESYISINIEDKKVFYRKCYTNIYNVGDCPTIITNSKKPTFQKIEDDSYCNQFGEEYFYQGDCDDSKRNCLDKTYYSDKCPNVFSDTKAVKFLIKRFNDDFSKEYGKINENYFDNYETIKKGVQNSIEHQKKIGLIKELPFPPVDIELVYGSFNPTTTALFLDDNDFTKEAKRYEKGGDGTVPTWSSLLTGFKWIYDKKKKNLPQKIKLIEYCSRLALSGKYKYNPYIEQNFSAISCQCFDNYNRYSQIKGCSHATMLGDNKLFEYLYSVVNDPKENMDDNIDSKIEAAKKYDSSYDYLGVCNNDIYDILNNSK